MTVKERYESAKEIYAKIGVDTDKAIETLKKHQYPFTAGREMMSKDLIRMDH